MVVGGPHGVMVKVLNWGIIGSEFKLQSHYYAPFLTNAPWEKYGPFILLDKC